MKLIRWFLSLFQKENSQRAMIATSRGHETALSEEMHVADENRAAQTKYRAESGKFLLVECYLGCKDRLFSVDTHEAGDILTDERYRLYRRADAEYYASWHLFDEDGNELPRLQKVA